MDLSNCAKPMENVRDNLLTILIFLTGAGLPVPQLSMHAVKGPFGAGQPMHLPHLPPVGKSEIVFITTYVNGRRPLLANQINHTPMHAPSDCLTYFNPSHCSEMIFSSACSAISAFQLSFLGSFARFGKVRRLNGWFAGKCILMPDHVHQARR